MRAATGALLTLVHGTGGWAAARATACAAADHQPVFHETRATSWGGAAHHRPPAPVSAGGVRAAAKPHAPAQVTYPFHDTGDELVAAALVRRARIHREGHWHYIRPGQAWEDGDVRGPTLPYPPAHDHGAGGDDARRAAVSARVPNHATTRAGRRRALHGPRTPRPLFFIGNQISACRTPSCCNRPHDQRGFRRGGRRQGGAPDHGRVSYPAPFHKSLCSMWARQEGADAASRLAAGPHVLRPAATRWSRVSNRQAGAAWPDGHSPERWRLAPPLGRGARGVCWPSGVSGVRAQVVSPLELDLCTEAELHKAAGAIKVRTPARAPARCRGRAWRAEAVHARTCPYMVSG